MTPTDPRILAIHRASSEFAENWSGEAPAATAARTRANEVGAPAVSPGAGAVLRLLAKLTNAKNVVEIGTGAGVSALWLLEGMEADGVLTSIDNEPEHQVIAREALTQAGIVANRVRLINSRPDEVIDRLTDGGYDLVLISGATHDLTDSIERGLALLRSGGILAVDQALWKDRVADPAHRDADTVNMRGALAQVAQDENLTASLLPVGAGLLIAVKN